MNQITTRVLNISLLMCLTLKTKFQNNSKTDIEQQILAMGIYYCLPNLKVITFRGVGSRQNFRKVCAAQDFSGTDCLA